MEFDRPNEPGNVHEVLPALLGLPQRPHWRVSVDQTVASVWGWHLTPTAARIAMMLASLCTLALLVYPGWYCWGFHIPDWLRLCVNTAALWFGYHPDFTERKWIYFGLWIVCWLAWRIWERLLYMLFCLLLRKRTAIHFTAEAIQLGRFGGHYLRNPITPTSFAAIQDPRLPWLLLKAQLRNSSVLSVFYQQIRVLMMAHGYGAYPIARFVSPEDAERFAAVCRFALTYPLKKPERSSLKTQDTHTEVQNVQDI